MSIAEIDSGTEIKFGSEIGETVCVGQGAHPRSIGRFATNVPFHSEFDLHRLSVARLTTRSASRAFAMERP